MLKPPPRYGTREAAELLSRLLKIENEDWMQDWPLEVCDPDRLTEFCDFYERGGDELDDHARFALMELILYSLDESIELQDWLSTQMHGAGRESIVPRICQIIRTDFLLHLHTVDYWRQAEEIDVENVFAITPLMRDMWSECFRTEYTQFLDEPALTPPDP